MAEWLHYVGGFYSPAKFWEEAARYGVQRRVPSNLVKSLSYGDRVTVLFWDQGKAHKIGTFTVNRLTLDERIGHAVGERLRAEGRAIYADAGGCVVRACGSYVAVGTWTVAATMGEVGEMAQEEAEKRGIEPVFLVGGPLDEVTNPPEELEEPDHFFRGFKRVSTDDALSGDDSASYVGGEVVEIEAYQKRQRVERKDIQMRLPIPA